jgi:hypothetical protein
VPIAMGLHTDLDEAAKLATREMIDFLVSEKGMKRDDAYILCSIAADFHVTQLVDDTKGVHAMIANPFLSINSNLTTCNRHAARRLFNSEPDRLKIEHFLELTPWKIFWRTFASRCG